MLFYDNKKQISFTTDFYSEIFNINAIKNDFIELKFKIYLEIDNINLSQNIQFTYKLLDDNSNQLFEFSKKLSQYKRINNKYILININILYFFIKNVESIKLVIEFNLLIFQFIELYYIKNNNYRLMLKHYGL